MALTEEELQKEQDRLTQKYNAGKAQNNPDQMQSANDEMNQIRTGNGIATQDASQDIQNQRSIISPYASSSSSSSSGGVSRLNSAEDDYYDQQVKALEAERSKIDPYYYGVRNNAATVQSQNQNAFNEYAAANGLNAGAGGQAALARQNVYGNAINAADVAEANAYSDIESQVRDLQAQKELQKEQNLYNEWLRQEQADATEKTNALAQQNYMQEWNQSLADKDYSKRENAAQLLASGGNFSGYQALYGLTDAEIAQLQKAYTVQNTPKSSGGGSGSSYKPTLTYAQTMEAISSNPPQLTPNVLAAYKYYMGTALDTSSGSAGVAMSPSAPAATTTQTSSGGSFVPPSTIARNNLTGNVPSETTLIQMLASGQIDESGFIQAMKSYGYDWTKYAQ